MAAKIGTVEAEVLLRIAGESVVVGTVDVPVSVDGPDEGGRAVVRFPKATVRAGLKQLAHRIAETLA
jgi:hypothetical protein